MAKVDESKRGPLVTVGASGEQSEKKRANNGNVAFVILSHGNGKW